MNANHLDVWFSKTKLRCIVTFGVFVLVFSLCCLDMYRCSRVILQYGDSSNYILLFEHADVEAFFLGRLIFNAMEYLYAGKSLLWIFLKSLRMTDVLMVMCMSVILFQDSALTCASRMKIFTSVLVISGGLILAVYAAFAAVASVQLTTDAGFHYLRLGAAYGQIASIGLVGCSWAMLIALILRK